MTAQPDKDTRALGVLDPSRRFGVLVQADDTGTWAGNGLRYATREEAVEAARDLAARWTLVREWRVERFRLARVNIRDGENVERLVQTVGQYLPRNYACHTPGPTEVWVEGYDDAGWTLDRYVLPRLASGLIVAVEATEEQPEPEHEDGRKLYQHPYPIPDGGTHGYDAFHTDAINHAPVELQADSSCDGDLAARFAGRLACSGGDEVTVNVNGDEAARIVFVQDLERGDPYAVRVARELLPEDPVRDAARRLLEDMETPRSRKATEAWDALRALLEVTP